jgi:hypothetical protein
VLFRPQSPTKVVCANLTDIRVDILTLKYKGTKLLQFPATLHHYWPSCGAEGRLVIKIWRQS